METVRAQLEMLSEDSDGKVNYESWRFKLDLILRSKDLVKIVNGTELRPEGSENDAAVKQWTTKDLEAQSLIGLNCSCNVAKKISKCTSARLMLDKLDMLYAKKSDVCVAGLQRKFINYTFYESKSVVENCCVIQELADTLAAEGEILKEGWIMNKILDMLPKRLHHFRTVWDNVSGTDKNINSLFERLRLEDDRQNEGDKNKSTMSTAFVHKQGNQNASSNSQKNECFKCGKKGHIKVNCKNKPCEKYIQYCKNKYGCKICHVKGHFAKECPNKNSSQSDKNNPGEDKRRAFITVSLSAVGSKLNEDVWIQDCGATQHMTSHSNWMTNYTLLNEEVQVILGDGSVIPGIGTGNVNLEAFDGKIWQKIVLNGVLHTPNIPFNLFSVTKILDKGYEHVENSEKSLFKLKNSNDIVAVGEREGNLFKMKFRRENTAKCMAAISIKDWHERMAHQNVKHIKEVLTSKNIVFKDDWDDYVCQGCVFGKQHRVSHPINSKVSTEPLEVVHVDLCEMNVRSLGGAKYFLLFKDDFTHYRTVYFLKNKNEAASKLEIFLKLVQNQFNKHVKTLKSDQGTEIKNAETQKLLEKLGVFHAKSTAYTPEQNGRIEREMRTVVEAARSVIHCKNLNENLWAEAVNYAVFTLNQTGTSSCKGKVPAELWFGRKMSIQKLKKFGCKCYVLIQDQFRKKTEKKSKTGIFVGYDFDAPSYRILLDESRQVISSNDVVFNENDIPESFCQFELYDKEEIVESDSEPISDDYESLESESSSDKEEKSLTVERTLRDRSKIRMPVRYENYEMQRNDKNFAMIAANEDIKLSDALNNKEWKLALNEELNSLHEMKTWDLVKPLKEVKPLSNRWILRKKEDGRLKARLVIRGF